MAEEDARKLAESVLRKLLMGSSVIGMRFFSPQITMDGPSDIGGDAFVSLGSEWVVFDKRPKKFPDSLPDITEEKEIAEIVKIRGEEIIDVEILKPWPHLVITFKSGKTLFLNGQDNLYEPWTAGLTHLGIKDRWLVVACPGGGLAIWAPDNFTSNESV